MQRNYLRARGEYKPTLLFQKKILELPPRTRRILAFPHASRYHRGTTSAHAENTAQILTLSRGTGNYLRARGEYLSLDPEIAFLTELPPRTRRIQNYRLLPPIAPGTTSAHAENTLGNNEFGLWPGNYLRARGEYDKNGQYMAGGMELPPRTRRIHSANESLMFRKGTTSAHAENTFTHIDDGIKTGNYLRARGEYHTRPSPTIGGGGTTSAHAENTPTRPDAVLSARNYLRARGEYVSSFGSGDR